MKNKNISALLVAIALSSCSSTDDLGAVFTSKEVNKPLWLNEPLVTGEQCDTLTVANVQSFLNKYAQTERLEDVSSDAGLEAMNTYTLASVLINRSQLCMSEALALKSTTETLLKEKEILLSGTSMSKNEIKKHREYSEAASAEIRAATQKIASLAPEKRKSFVFGMSTYLTGTAATAKIKKALANYVEKTKGNLSQANQQVKSGSIEGIYNTVSTSVSSLWSNGNVIHDIMEGLPGHGQNLYETGSYFIAYAKQQNLDLPADATDEFLSTVGW